jgi:hypothetical protein
MKEEEKCEKCQYAACDNILYCDAYDKPADEVKHCDYQPLYYLYKSSLSTILGLLNKDIS